MSNDFYTSKILPYAGIIIKICRAYTNNQQDFEDNYQEVCLQIWRSRENFKGDSEWSTWIYRISLNVCLTIAKKKKNSTQEINEKHLNDTTDESGFISEDSLKELYIAIKKLPEIDRAVILLYLEEKSSQEIADIIGTKPLNIRVRINRIKTKLKTLLDGKIN